VAAKKGGVVTDDEAPLAGVRVLEMSMYIQGPVAGLVLAGLGADVIKVEQVGTLDAMRTWVQIHGLSLDARGQAWMYAALNRDKRAITLDPTTDRGRAVFHRLIARSDVFLTNLRTEGLRRMGAGFDDLRAINESIVYAQGGGLGFRGPLAALPCQDTVGMAYGGFMDNSSPTEEPNYPPGSMSDVLTGTNLAGAVLAGLVRRSTTGRGGLVRASQLQSMLWLQMLPVGCMASIGERMQRFDRSAVSPLYSPFATGDGWIAVAAIHDHQWPPLARALGLEHLLDDPRYASLATIEHNKRSLAVEFEQAFALRTTLEWWERLRVAGVWCSPVNRIEDLPTDEQAWANDYLVRFPDGFIGTPGPYQIDDWPGLRSTASEYGEHTDEVLTELGFTAQEIGALRVDSTVW
jgi:CoA:oxalate CoA-transferase